MQRPPPKGKGNDLWQKCYNDSVKSNHPNPELMADSFLRVRERRLEIAESRPTLQKNEDTPNKGRTIPPLVLRCKATKMDGKQCEFKSKNGDFCTKHSLKN